MQTFAYGSCPWYGRPYCIRSQTILRIRHSSASLSPGGPLRLWWLCTGRDAWGNRCPHEPDRSPYRTNVSNYNHSIQQNCSTEHTSSSAWSSLVATHPFLHNYPRKKNRGRKLLPDASGVSKEKSPISGVILAPR